MSKKIKDTDYLFQSAYIRSLENTLLTRERMERMLDAATTEEAAKVLTECGYPEISKVNVDTINEMLAVARDQVISEVTSLSRDTRMVDVFKIKYDYHNAKVMLKSEAMGEDPKRLLVDSGRMPGKELAEAVENGNYDQVPEALAKAIVQAREVLGATKDPQQADFLLDQAYFKEMDAMAKSTGSKFLIGYVQLMVEAANLRSLVRVLRLGKDQTFLKNVLFEGGLVEPWRFMNVGEDGAGMEELYLGTDLQNAAELGRKAVGGGSLTEFEKACDNALVAYLTQAQSVPFGEQPMIAYLAARDNEFTAVRIILTGRLAGLSADQIRERLRDAYV